MKALLAPAVRIHADLVSAPDLRAHLAAVRVEHDIVGDVLVQPAFTGERARRIRIGQEPIRTSLEQVTIRSVHEHQPLSQYRRKQDGDGLILDE